MEQKIDYYGIYILQLDANNISQPIHITWNRLHRQFTNKTPKQ